MPAAISPERTSVDLVVVGSGAGGLAAAVTARKHGLDVLVVEKEPLYGGATARSGGWLWIPCNPLAVEAGVTDSIDAARTYLAHEAGNHFDAERVDAFLANGPRMVSFLERETAVKFVLGPEFSDYHPDTPGALPGGRSICAVPFDARELGANIAGLRPPMREITLLGLMIGSGKEVAHFFNVTRSLKSAAYVARLLAIYARDMLTHRRPMRLTNGNALIARLAKSAFDLGVPIRLSAGAKELITDANGAVCGVVVERDGRSVTIAARRGVVLACGGFPRDSRRRAALFPRGPAQHNHSPAPVGNTGDGLSLAEAVGAAVEETLPNAAAWLPVSRVYHRDGTSGVFPHFVDRAKPGVIAVTRRGTRFVNEANSYHDFVQAMMAACRDDEEITAWLICDHPTIRRFGLGFAKPFPLPLTPYLRSGYLKRGDTLAELAATCGIDPAALQRTVADYNAHAREGRDPQFNKGSNAYNRYLADPARKPNPCVGPLEKVPFYAVKLVVGELGTYAGLKTDGYARVLNTNGAPITGLYAAGNDMASVMGGNYPGGGITIGPAMTFGYIAGRHAAGVASNHRSASIASAAAAPPLIAPLNPPPPE